MQGSFNYGGDGGIPAASPSARAGPSARSIPQAA